MAWICPQCGRTLRVRNQEHVCDLQSLESHFERRDPVGRVAFNCMCSVFAELGPYDVLPMKTTIGFASGVNVAFLTTKRDGAVISLVLAEDRASPRFYERSVYSRMKAIFRVRVATESDLDEELRDLLREAYALSV